MDLDYHQTIGPRRPDNRPVRPVWHRVVAVSVLLLLSALSPSLHAAESRKSRLVFSDMTKKSGVSFRHTHGGSGERYIVESVSAGLALFDYDADGDVDIYFLNGAPLKGTDVSTPPKNALYRNDGDWKFTDVTDEAGVGDTGFGLGVCVGDYDNDGDEDLYLNNYGPNVLYRNNGDGTFTDVTTQADVADGHKVGAGANFLDIDADGDLDLFSANYLQFSYEVHVPRTTRGIPKYSGPRDYLPQPNTLFRNNGDGTFSDISKPSGIGQHAGWGMGTVAGDYDNDGDTDILVANDVSANFLFENDGSGRFSEVGLITGIAYDVSGREQASMGLDLGDFDNDGWLDLYATSYQKELATLYRNTADGFFQDVTQLARAGLRTFPYVTWGNTLADFDNDGDQDIFVACGHIQDNIELYDDTSSYHTRNILLLNDGNRRFVDISDSAGEGLRVKLASRGAAFDDLDNDGDLDAVIQNITREPTLLRNDQTTANHWLHVELRGTTGNRFGIGARVKVVAGDLTQVKEVHSGRGYQSHYGRRLHFGLGSRRHIDRVEVIWIGGKKEVRSNLESNQILTITESSQ